VHYGYFVDESIRTRTCILKQGGLQKYPRPEKARVQPALQLSIEKCGLIQEIEVKIRRREKPERIDAIGHGDRMAEMLTERPQFHVRNDRN
jgi:hypothetical protein